MNNQPNDNKTTVQELKTIVENFIRDREWQQFHSPKNLAMAIAVEAAELMDIFKWQTSDATSEGLEDAEIRVQTEDELADILVYALAFANRYKIDISSAMRRKMLKNEQKYPSEEFRGRY